MPTPPKIYTVTQINSLIKDVLDANTKTSHSELKSAVLRALHQYTGKGLTHDDVTMIVLEIC